MMKMTTSRPEPGMLLPADDPRVIAAYRAVLPLIGGEEFIQNWDMRDVAEIVNAVLAADDEIHDRPLDWCRSSFDLPEAPTERP